MENIFKDSLIIKEDETKMVCDWIDPNKEIKAKLLYRVTRDGDGGDIFHKFCDGKGPLIVFIKAKSGNRLGAFTGISWARDNEPKDDDKLFLFSLDNKLKIVNENPKLKVAHMEGYGPCFGCPWTAELVINNYTCRCLKGNMNFCKPQSGYNLSNKDLFGVDTEDAYNFDCEDFEVYSIEY